MLNSGKRKKICLVIPSLSSGGMERVMTQLAFYLAAQDDCSVSLIVMTRGESFYELPDNIELVQPGFRHSEYSRLIFTIRTLKFVRKELKRIQPQAILSFGGKYNAFVLLAAWRLPSKVFISDRSRPGISYGKLLDALNAVVYRYADGIVAQTEKAKAFHVSQVRHRNISVIGNPIRSFNPCKSERQNVILNVGRFIPSKNQELLIEYFSKLDFKHWKLVFLGDGKLLDKCKMKARELGVADHVEFAGNQKDIDRYYCSSKIFAFTSASEGFPNALGEAMAAGMACISFDCNAGPSDLIDDNVNGFLIPSDNHEEFTQKLDRLMNDEALRNTFGKEAVRKLQQFLPAVIGRKFYDFIFTGI